MVDLTLQYQCDESALSRKDIRHIHSCNTYLLVQTDPRGLWPQFSPPPPRHPPVRQVLSVPRVQLDLWLLFHPPLRTSLLLPSFLPDPPDQWALLCWAAALKIIITKNIGLTLSSLKLPLSSHPLQAVNCCRNSRLVVDEDDLKWVEN